MSETHTEWVQVTTTDELAANDGRMVASADGHAVALFDHEDEVYAVDNRCPHMGFPLHRGTVDDGILTCHWHHARFELDCGGTFDPWADDVRSFPTEVRDGEVWVDTAPDPDLDPVEHWKDRLADGLEENLRLVVAKSVIGLLDEDVPFTEPLAIGVGFGTTYREDGWGSGLVIHSAMANVADALDDEDRKRALYTGLRHVASDCDDQPPTFGHEAFSTRDVPPERLKEWFRECVEVRDRDGAERCLRTAIAADLPPTELADILFTAATDHLYLDAGHTVDFVNKAFEVLDHVGWEHADAVLPSVIPRLTEATRSEELSNWRQPVDLADLLFETFDDLPELVATGEEETWERPTGFVETLLVDDPHEVVGALKGAIENGASVEQLAAAVASAAVTRVAQFGTSNEFNDWNTVHHTASYCNAVHVAARRTDATALYRGVLAGAMSVYLDRFLNTPPTPIPDPDGTDADPATIRQELLDTFDEEGDVDRAGRLVARYLAADGDVAALKSTLGHGLLREDAGFHTLQSLEWGFNQYDMAPDAETRRRALVAAARYMGAHFPTRREAEQTFTIAARLSRGEKLHEES